VNEVTKSKEIDMKNAIGVRNGRRLVVSYPVGGNRNILKTRDGKILRKVFLPTVNMLFCNTLTRASTVLLVCQ
jgi:hypothetical protein